MLRKSILTISLQILNFALFAQNTETRQVPPFTKIEIESVSRIYLKQEAQQAIRVSSGGSLSKIETTVSKGTLHVDGASGSEIYVSIPQLDKISIEGKGDIIGQTPFNGDKLDLEIGGNGKMNMEIHYRKVNAEISGLGKITLTGTADNADLDISGSGRIDAMDMKVTNCKANVSGVGKCMIDVSDTLTTNISGSGFINYKNAPKVLNKNISGVGRIGDYKEASGKSDTTHLNFGTTEVIIISPKDTIKIKKKSGSKPIWSGLEMGFNTYVNANGSFTLPAAYTNFELRQEKSISVSLNLLQKNFRLGQSNVWFFTGLGVTWNNYRFANNVTLNPTTPVTTSVDTTSNINHIKSKLVAVYLTAPLMFEVFTSRDTKQAFHLGAGALVGMRIGSHSQQKYEIDGDSFKPKAYSDFNLNPFRYGVRVALGYKKFNVFADYYMSTLFKDQKGPTLYPMNFGITLVGG